MSIRPVTLSDAATWARLRAELWPDDHRTEVDAYFRGELDEPEAVFLIESDNQEVVGFVELSVRMDVPSREGHATGFVEGLYVTERARHSGVARALLRRAQDWARERGCDGFGADRAGRYILDPRFR